MDLRRTYLSMIYKVIEMVLFGFALYLLIVEKNLVAGLVAFVLSNQMEIRSRNA